LALDDLKRSEDIGKELQDITGGLEVHKIADQILTEIVNDVKILKGPKKLYSKKRSQLRSTER
jgi:hypothetical protein